MKWEVFMSMVIAISCLKGGTGKTQTSMNLAAGLARQGKRILCLDADSQHSLTVSFGVNKPELLPTTLTTVLTHIINDTAFDPKQGIIKHPEGMDILPSNGSLAGLEFALIQQMNRESILRRYIKMVSQYYDYIIVDTAPTFNQMTMNALVAANKLIIPVTPRFLDAKGLELLFKSVAKIKYELNPSLTIAGILFTMVNRRINFVNDIISLIENAYGANVCVFASHIPCSIRAAEASAQGISIFFHDPKGKVAMAYGALVKAVKCNA
jgi:chromosome partitioning protein